MRRTISMAVFLGVFMAAYAALNYFVLSSILNLVEMDGILTLILTAFFTLAFPFATVIERSFPNIATRVLYTITALWMGVLLFLAVLFGIYNLLRIFAAIPAFTAGIAIITITAGLTAYSVFNASRIRVRRVRTGLPLRIVQLSDIHFGTVRNSCYLRKVADITNSLKPDVVAITGDLVDGTAPLKEGMFEPLKKLNAPVLFVTGNHEVYEGEEKVRKMLKNVTILDNTSKRIKGVQFTGVGFKKRLKRGGSGHAVLLRHAPSGMKQAERAGFRLQLSGHTHNGQIFPFNLIVKLFFPRIRGMYRIGRMKLYVSPGTGTWGPYMRLGSRNEITVFEG